MDKAALLAQLENDKKTVEAWYDHPIAREFRKDLGEQQERLVDLILENPVINVETFLAREQALGHLRGLRRLNALYLDKLEEIQNQINAETT